MVTRCSDVEALLSIYSRIVMLVIVLIAKEVKSVRKSRL